LALNLASHDQFQSQFLPDHRNVVVYLPPGYDDDPTARYPVLYLQDGQNLFDPQTAFKKGEHWRVGETATALIDAHRIAPLIIVGIANTGPRRLFEYTPSYDRRRGGGGADLYGQLLTQELKPFIDQRYRTRPGRSDTGIGGSSLGGLVSLYLGLKYPGVFSRIAVMSPSVWWDRRVILRHVRDARPKPPLKLWVDIGTREGRYHVDNTQLLKAGLLKAGWIEAVDLHYEEVTGASHTEAAWADRLGRVLEFLFPPLTAPDVPDSLP
jgi:predicted alpha/beta superfamily hydrolase